LELARWRTFGRSILEYYVYEQKEVSVSRHIHSSANVAAGNTHRFADQHPEGCRFIRARLVQPAKCGLYWARQQTSRARRQDPAHSKQVAQALFRFADDVLKGLMPSWIRAMPVGGLSSTDKKVMQISGVAFSCWVF